MENVIHYLTLDLTGADLCPMIEVQRGDSARSLVIALTQGGRPYWIDEGLTAALFATKPDGNPLFNACAIEKNRIRYDFTPQTANVVGTFDCEIWLVAGDKREMTTPRFTIAVDERMRTDDVIPESEPEYTAITEMVAAGTAMIEELREALAGLEGVEEILTQARAAMEDAEAAASHAQTLAGQAHSASQQSSKYAYEARQAQAAAEAAAKRAEEAAAGVGQGGGNGAVQNPALTAAQINAMHGMFKVCVFNTNTDVDAAISAFEAAFGITGGGETPEEPDVPGTTVYTITYELVNVNSSNRTATVAEGASCSATLTAADGYTMDGATVSVTMGGVDVTADVYADGVIRIASVTGNISIMASARVEEAAPELLTDGLLGFWDFRQPAEPIGQNWHYAYPPNTGSGAYMCGGPGTLGSGGMPAFDSQYGTPGWFGCALDANNTLKDLGPEFTYVYLNRGTISGDLNGPNGLAPSNIPPGWVFAAQYYMESSVTETARPSAGNNGDSIEDYNFNVKRVSGAELKVIMDTSEYIFNGADYESFDHWNQTATVMPYRSGGTHIACAVYSRALTDVEIENMRAFMKTLEVSA